MVKQFMDNIDGNLTRKNSLRDLSSHYKKTSD
jgi:hypothetical protein